jgi:hypothetical protein
MRDKTAFFSILTTLLIVFNLPLISYETLIFESGFSHGDLSWSFLAPDSAPSFKSKLNIDDIHIYQMAITWRAEPCYNAYTRGKASLGWVLDGNFHESIQESDRDSRPSCGPYFSEKGHTRGLLDGKTVVNLSYGIGTPLWISHCPFQLIPLVGYSYYEINLRIVPAKQLTRSHDDISQDYIRHGLCLLRNCCINNKFVQRLWGPWFGFDLRFNPFCYWNIIGQFEYHIAHFKGIRFTNIGYRPFDEFNHSISHARGYEAKIENLFNVCHCWVIGFNVAYQSWNAHKTFKERFSHSKLKTSYKWHSWAINLSLGKLF